MRCGTSVVACSCTCLSAEAQAAAWDAHEAARVKVGATVAAGGVGVDHINLAIAAGMGKDGYPLTPDTPTTPLEAGIVGRHHSMGGATIAADPASDDVAASPPPSVAGAGAVDSVAPLALPAAAMPSAPAHSRKHSSEEATANAIAAGMA